MSEYTPTTKDVREVWIYAQDITHDEGEDFHGAEFDRWLAAHDAEVQAQVVAEEPEWGIAHVATPGSVWPLSEDGARETAAIEPGQWIIYSRPKTVTHEWVPVKQEGAETDA